MAMDTIVIYPDQEEEFRWRRVAPNGETTADSGEGYSSFKAGYDAALREGDGKAKVVRRLTTATEDEVLFDPSTSDAEPEDSSY